MAQAKVLFVAQISERAYCHSAQPVARAAALQDAENTGQQELAPGPNSLGAHRPLFVPELGKNLAQLSPCVRIDSATTRQALQRPPRRLSDEATITARLSPRTSTDPSHRGAMLPGVHVPEQSNSTTTTTTLAVDTPQRSTGTTRTLTEPNVTPFLRIVSIWLDSVSDADPEKRLINLAVAVYDGPLTIKRPIIGEGCHFTVFASPFESVDDRPAKVVRLGYNSEVYCMKSPNQSKQNEIPNFNAEIRRIVLQELTVLQHPRLSNHENIIGLLGVEFLEDYDYPSVSLPCLLMEFADYGTLETFREDRNGIPPNLCQQFLVDAGLGIQSLHNANIIHGDVKSENILICKHQSRQFIAKVSDFGLSVTNPDPGAQHNLPGRTWKWCAPESEDLLTVDGLKATDTYSFGLMVWRVFSNLPNPFGTFGPDVRARYDFAKEDEFIEAVIADPDFSTMILHSISTSSLSWDLKNMLQAAISATVALDPGKRSLRKALDSLARKDNHAINKYVLL